MKKLTPQIVTIILLCAMYCGCKPKDCHKDGTCAQDYRRFPLGDAQNYLYTLPGSYWIYKNSSTGKLDTQVCIEFKLDTLISRGHYNETKHITIEYERIQRNIQSTYFKCYFNDETTGFNADFPVPFQIVLETEANSYTADNFFYPFVINTHINVSPSFLTTCKEILPNLTVQGKPYTQVVNFEIEGDNIWYTNRDGIPIQFWYPRTNYYWAKDVGLIKRFSRSENYSWELIDYKIIR